MAEKQCYLLSVEGVNLSAFVFDTTDLSTIRGGGLLLLEAVERVQEKLVELAETDSVTAISTGASSGLFEFQAERGERIRNEIEEFLNRDQQLKHASFVVDVIETDGKDFQKKKETLLAMNRWRQMQSPSLSIPENGSISIEPCETDLIRPALSPSKVSASVWERSQYGREQKRGKFYVKLIGLPEDYAKFTNNLTELSKDLNQGNLNHKIAVIYADGNSFGQLQSGFDEKTLQRFDTEIKEKRKAFLAALIEKIEIDAGWKNEGKNRLETLLWGGDEFILVVPAWKGWETLQLFYQLSEKWQFEYKKTDGTVSSEKLTHSAGLVFCHHNAPIHRIKNLAHDLAEICKDESIVGAKDNYFACQVLEAFDHIGGPIKNYLRKMSIDRKIRPMIFSGDKMSSIAKNIAGIKSDSEFARGRLHDIVKQYRTGEAEKAKKNVEIIRDKLTTSLATVSEIAELEKILGAEYCWLHLADLYDYISVLQQEESHD